MVEPNVRQRYPNAAEALDALIPLQVLRPAETSKVPVVTAGLLAVGVAFCVPVVMKFSAPEVEPQKVEEQNAGEVIVTADPKSVKNTDSISLNQKRVYFSVKINTNNPKSQAIGTCQLFDSAGILVAMGQSPLQVSESGLLSAYCWYDFKKIDSAGNWTFKFNVDGQKAVQKNLLVLYIQPQPTPPKGREEG
jgi:hypothetical protein